MSHPMTLRSHTGSLPHRTSRPEQNGAEDLDVMSSANYEEVNKRHKIPIGCWVIPKNSNCLNNETFYITQVI